MTRVREIKDFLKESIVDFSGDESAEVMGVAPLGAAQPGQLSFCTARAADPEKALNSSKASCVIVDVAHKDKLAPGKVTGKSLIFCDNPRLQFIKTVERFFTETRKPGIHPSAHLGEGVEVGTGTYVGPKAVLEDGASVGKDCVIHGGVFIYRGVKIGDRVTIHAGTVIGADGFGYERDETGALIKFPHLGGVVIENDVEIGSNTCIDRGTLGNTQIKNGAKIDNLVHIAHNVVVGEHAVVIANAMIAGSTVIGDYAWVAPCATVREQLKIGKSSVVGLASLVTKDVPESTTVMGVPARPLEEQKVLLKKLSEMATS